MQYKKYLNLCAMFLLFYCVDLGASFSANEVEKHFLYTECDDYLELIRHIRNRMTSINAEYKSVPLAFFRPSSQTGYFAATCTLDLDKAVELNTPFINHRFNLSEYFNWEMVYDKLETTTNRGFLHEGAILTYLVADETIEECLPRLKDLVSQIVSSDMLLKLMKESPALLENQDFATKFIGLLNQEIESDSRDEVIVFEKRDGDDSILVQKEVWMKSEVIQAKLTRWLEDGPSTILIEPNLWDDVILLNQFYAGEILSSYDLVESVANVIDFYGLPPLRNSVKSLETLELIKMVANLNVDNFLFFLRSNIFARIARSIAIGETHELFNAHYTMTLAAKIYTLFIDNTDCKTILDEINNILTDNHITLPVSDNDDLYLKSKFTDFMKENINADNLNNGMILPHSPESNLIYFGKSDDDIIAAAENNFAVFVFNPSKQYHIDNSYKRRIRKLVKQHSPFTLVYFSEKYWHEAMDNSLDNEPNVPNWFGHTDSKPLWRNLRPKENN